MLRIMAAAAALVAASPAAGEVKSASPNGFEIEHRIDTPLPPARLYDLLVAVERWWSDAHTYSGKAANLSLVAAPGGCWCEKLPGGGGVEHLRVAFVDPGKRLVLTGALGPLLTEAISGAMQLTIAPRDGGSSLVMNYRAAGFYKGGADRLAPLVDRVLAEQMQSLGRAAAAPAPR